MMDIFFNRGKVKIIFRIWISIAIFSSLVFPILSLQAKDLLVWDLIAGQGVTENEAKEIKDIMQNRIYHQDLYRLTLPEYYSSEVFEEPPNCHNKDCILYVTRKLGADFVLLATLQRYEEGYELSGDILDAISGTSRQRVSSRVNRLGEELAWDIERQILSKERFSKEQGSCHSKGLQYSWQDQKCINLRSDCEGVWSSHRCFKDIMVHREELELLRSLNKIKWEDYTTTFEYTDGFWNKISFASFSNEKVNPKILQMHFIQKKSKDVSGLNLGVFTKFQTTKYEDSSTRIARVSGVSLTAYSKKHTANGVSIGLVGNQTQKATGMILGGVWNRTREIKGVAIGMYNYACKAKGIQLGLFNYSETKSSLQIGLFNYASENMIPFFPLINLNFSSREEGIGKKAKGKHFCAADLRGKSFTDTNLSEADFTDSDLRGANFSRANLKNTIFKGADLRRVNFRKRNLDGTDFKKANLEYADFKRSDLRKANLRGANLQLASFLEANVQEVNFQGATLISTNFIRANLERAIFEDEFLSWTSFIDANLKQANLRGINMSYVDFTGANLERANLERARALWVKLLKANLQKANLKRANLERVEFDYSNLRGANLSYSNLKRAYFTGANLENADLSYTDLKQAHFQGAILKNTNFKGAKNCPEPIQHLCKL